jgi:hypothetical protein
VGSYARRSTGQRTGPHASACKQRTAEIVVVPLHPGAVSEALHVSYRRGQNELRAVIHTDVLSPSRIPRILFCRHLLKLLARLVTFVRDVPVSKVLSDGPGKP